MERSMTFSLEPDWEVIERIRQKSASFLVSHKLKDENVEALTMIISELIENSIKYGSFSLGRDKVLINIKVDKNIVTIEVVNPVDERTHGHLRKMDKTIQWIRGYQDSFQAYIERLRQVAIKPFNDEESGLGLIRIAYEGQAILDFYVDEENLLNVSAVSSSYRN